MIRRQARLRREYIYRKNIELKERTKIANRMKIKEAIENNQPIPHNLRQEALELQQEAEWLDEAGDGLTTHEDDEYKWAGVTDPKLVLTTSRAPSSKLKQFAKEMKLVFPNCQRINRGTYDVKALIEACKANDVTDLIMIDEHRGVPNSLTICHFPFGPTVVFTMYNVIMRHDIPDVGHMSQQYPHLIFNNFKTKLGKRLESVLKYLFPVPKEDSHRVITFSNDNDFLSFRHHTFKKAPGNDVELSEAGPRFELKLYSIKLGTLDTLQAADTEYILRPYMNTAKKRQFLSDDAPI